LPSEANFVLVMFDDAERALRVQDAIGEAGFAVRHLGGALSHALRITIGTADQMRQVASAIRGAMEDE
jgi:histidinol-phosphate aminotransferase